MTTAYTIVSATLEDVAAVKKLANAYRLARTEMGKKRPLNVWERQG